VNSSPFDSDTKTGCKLDCIFEDYFEHYVWSAINGYELITPIYQCMLISLIFITWTLIMSGNWNHGFWRTQRNTENKYKNKSTSTNTKKSSLRQ